MRARRICKHDAVRCKTVKLIEVLYVLQAVKNLLSASRIVSKVGTMGANQDKLVIKKNGVSMILDARKCKSGSMMIYFQAKRYAPEVQEALTNQSEK